MTKALMRDGSGALLYASSKARSSEWFKASVMPFWVVFEVLGGSWWRTGMIFTRARSVK